MMTSTDLNSLCKRHGISRATLYRVWKRGEGPAFYYVGSHRRISAEAELAWLRKREALASAPKA